MEMKNIILPSCSSIDITDTWILKRAKYKEKKKAASRSKERGDKVVSLVLMLMLVSVNETGLKGFK